MKRTRSHVRPGRARPRRRVATGAAATLLSLACCAVTGASELQFVDGASLGQFIDISLTSGENLMLGEDEEVALSGSSMGNFVFAPGLVVVGQNGGLSFGTGSVFNLEAVNQQIPSNDAFLGSQAGLVFWDDIDDKEGDVFALELPDRLIVQWNFGNFEGTGATLKCQIQVLNNPAPTGIYAHFIYQVEPPIAGAGISATIGYQDGLAGFGDLQHSFNTADAVTSGTVLSLLIPGPCPADLTNDRIVNIDDVQEVVLNYGCGGPACDGDANNDGRVNIDDIQEVVLAWGPCL